MPIDYTPCESFKMLERGNGLSSRTSPPAAAFRKPDLTRIVPEDTGFRPLPRKIRALQFLIALGGIPLVFCLLLLFPVAWLGRQAETLGQRLGRWYDRLGGSVGL